MGESEVVLESSKFSTNTYTAKLYLFVCKVRTASPGTLETEKAYGNPRLNRYASTNGINIPKLSKTQIGTGGSAVTTIPRALSEKKKKKKRPVERCMLECVFLVGPAKATPTPS